MRLNKLNGWQRLWVLVSAIYLFVVIFFAVFTFPSPENNTDADKILKSLPTKSLEILAGQSSGVPDKLTDEHSKTIPVTYPNGQVLEFLPSTNKTDIEYVSKEYWNTVTDLTNTKRIIFLFQMLLAWIVPCVILYLLSWSIGWVYKGFIKEQ